MEYYPRKVEEKILKLIKRREFLIIRGARQVGKTTLLKHLQSILENADYITFEDIEIRSIFSKYTKEFIEREISKGIKYLLIDEVQYVKDIGQKLKLIFDLYSEKIKLIVSGSGSFDIKVEVGKYMVGRAFNILLYSLSFEEFLLWKAKDLHKYYKEFFNSLTDVLNSENENIASPTFEEEFLKLFKEFIVFGGYPEVVKENDFETKKLILKEIISNYLERDVGYFLGIRNIEKFRDLLVYLADNISKIIEYSSIISDIKISFQILQNYLEILQQSFIISLIRPFYTRKTTELKKSRKLFFIDLGLRNALINNFQKFDERNDKGLLLENFVFCELLRNLEDWNINYWRSKSKAEVDFVISKENKIIPIEVKISPEISRSLISFINLYKPKVAIVFNLEKFEIKRVNNTKVFFLPVYYI
ncbi:MAG: ATP-binding protein [Candidatus Aenigmatarchaeota archaeon]